ncbi:MAG: ATPase, partial [Candidatus Omnitrophica bacterium]|nr:ATPase [Candidatus Omnitrophota bacterium]
APLAFEIYRQTGALGNSYVFLEAGVVTDITEVGLVWSNIGKRTALAMLTFAIPQIVLIGWLFNQWRV